MTPEKEKDQIVVGDPRQALELLGELSEGASIIDMTVLARLIVVERAKDDPNDGAL